MKQKLQISNRKHTQEYTHHNFIIYKTGKKVNREMFEYRRVHTDGWRKIVESTLIFVFHLRVRILISISFSSVYKFLKINQCDLVTLNVINVMS